MICEATLPSGRDCMGDVVEGAPLALCMKHLREAHAFIQDVEGLQRMPRACILCGEHHGTHEAYGWVCSHCTFGSPAGPEITTVRGAPVVPVVYYILFGDRIKIGYSANPEQRIAGLPHDEVLALEPGGRDLEAQRHGEFAATRIARTEWFHISEELLAHIAELRGDATDPWDQLAEWRHQQASARGKRR